MAPEQVQILYLLVQIRFMPPVRRRASLGAAMFTDATSILGAGATAYSLAAGAALLLQARTVLRRRGSCEVSLTFLAVTAGGYLIWLLYGTAIASLPLILSDAIGLVCALITAAVAARQRGPLRRPGSWACD